jgi:hypothetical protein
LAGIPREKAIPYIKAAWEQSGAALTDAEAEEILQQVASGEQLVRPATPAETVAVAAASSRTTGVLTGEEWLTGDFTTPESGVIIGSPRQAIIRPYTKNIIEAPDKKFKTAFTMRLTLGVSSSRTVYRNLPVLRARKVLYVHGELSPLEIQERTQGASAGLPRPLDNFLQVRDLRIHLIQAQGQAQLREIVAQHRPDDLVLDPLQSFIVGYDENEYKDMSQATRIVDEMIAEYGVTAYICTHTGKDVTRGTRGHSTIAGWRDTLIKLERKGQSRLVRVTVEPRWAAPVAPFTLRFADGTLHDTDAEPFTKQATEIREVVAAHGGRATKTQVGATLKLEGDVLRMALTRAAASGAIGLDGDEVVLGDGEDEEYVRNMPVEDDGAQNVVPRGFRFDEEAE